MNVELKQSVCWIFALLMMLGAYSCSDENIGHSITDTKSSIIEDSTFVMTGVSVPNTKLQARTSTQLVGEINCAGYGRLKSDVVCQLMPANRIDTIGTNVDLIDSCRLVLCLKASDGFTGDSLAPMRMTVYELEQTLPEPIYSDFSAEGYYNPNKPIASVSYSPASAKQYSEYSYTDGTTVTWREIAIPMPVEYAKRMHNLYVTNPAAFGDPEEFKKHFRGLYVTNSYGSGRMMNYYATELEVYYRQHTTVRDTVDTIQVSQQVYAASTPEVITNNNLSLSADESVKEMVANGEAIVMGPSGYEVNVHFPIQDIINTYKANTADGLSVINSLQLTIPVEQISNEYNIAPPAYLLMVKKDKKNDFFEGDSLTNNKDSFYATYNSATKEYVFSGLRPYILNILNNKGGIATDEDINLTLTPIDVASYTQMSNYYYYYGSSQTVVTKISPAVSQPAIAKLRLDKAKIKVVYSKQSVY